MNRTNNEIEIIVHAKLHLQSKA